MAERMLTARIAEAFDNAATTYDSVADAQQQAGRWLLEAVTPSISKNTIADVGCGTGWLLPLIQQRFPNAALIGIDNAPAMLRLAQQRCPLATFRCADISHLSLTGIDRIISNLCVQWLPDAPRLVQQWDKPFALTTLGENTFCEWRRGCEAVGAACGVPTYPSRAEWQLYLPHARVEERIIQQAYPSGREFLRALKQLGAHTPQSGYRPLTIPALRAVLTTLSKQGITTYSYHILRISAWE